MPRTSNMPIIKRSLWAIHAHAESVWHKLRSHRVEWDHFGDVVCHTCNKCLWLGKQ